MSEIDRLITRAARREAEPTVGEVGPLYATRHNSESVLGLPWRAVRELARSSAFNGEVLRNGKTVMVRLADLLEHLRDLSFEQRSNHHPKRDAADEVLDEIIGPEMVRVV